MVPLAYFLMFFTAKSFCFNPQKPNRRAKRFTIRIRLFGKHHLKKLEHTKAHDVIEDMSLIDDLTKNFRKFQNIQSTKAQD